MILRVQRIRRHYRRGELSKKSEADLRKDICIGLRHGLGLQLDKSLKIDRVQQRQLDQSLAQRT